MRFALSAALAFGMISGPALADEVNIYSYRQPELIQPMLDAFTEATGIETNVVYINKGLVQRLQAEGSRSPADLILTVDISRLAEAVEMGVTQPVNSDVIEANIPAEFQDASNQWFGLTARARVVYASKDRVAEGEVTTYEDLASDKWEGRICTRSGAHAYNVALLSAVIAHDGAEAATAWLEGVKSNLARKPQGNDRAQVKAIWAGECDISIGNTYYMGKMLADEEQQEWANSVNIVYPVFEEGGAHMNLSGMAMTKAAPNRENALKLMEFLTEDVAQALYAEVNYEFPLKKGVPASELVQSWGSFEADKTPLTLIAQNRPAALRIVETVDFDK